MPPTSTSCSGISRQVEDCGMVRKISLLAFHCSLTSELPLSPQDYHKTITYTKPLDLGGEGEGGGTKGAKKTRR